MLQPWRVQPKTYKKKKVSITPICSGIVHRTSLFYTNQNRTICRNAYHLPSSFYFFSLQPLYPWPLYQWRSPHQGPDRRHIHWHPKTWKKNLRMTPICSVPQYTRHKHICLYSINMAPRQNIIRPNVNYYLPAEYQHPSWYPWPPPHQGQDHHQFHKKKI